MNKMNKKNKKKTKIRRVIPSSKRLYLDCFEVGDVVDIYKLEVISVVGDHDNAKSST